MSINLSRFAQEKEVIAPIIAGGCVCDGRRLTFDDSVDDNWYRIFIGSSPRIIRRATPLEVKKTTEKQKLYLGFPLGSEVVPYSFENFYRLGYGESIPVLFMNARPFNIVYFFKWEDGRFYFEKEAMPPLVLTRARELFQQELPININHTSPEMRYYFLLLSLQRQSYREIKLLEEMKLAEEEKEKRIKEFQNTFSGRLKKIVEDAGGKLIRFERNSDTNYTVTWSVGGQTIKSQINDQFKIYSLGYCASGADRKYFLDSAIQLAKTFQERSPLYITHY